MTAPKAPIVVPLDGSKNAEYAVPMAAWLAGLYEAPVRFMHVTEPDLVASAKDLDAAQQHFASYAADMAARAGLGPSDYSADLFAGSPGSVVLENSGEARLIVLASHGRGGFHATFIGSVADKIVRGARVPVLVVPAIDGEETVSVRMIVVALDGSEGGERGLAVAREIAEKAGAKLALVRAYSTPPAVGIEFAYYPPDLLTSLEQAAREYLEGIARPGEQCVLAHGAAAEVIAKAALDLDADLVVMASHGKGLAGRLALGSTTDRVMHSLRRPLIIVPGARD